MAHVPDEVLDGPHEQTALLQKAPKRKTPLPKQQVAAIMFSQLVEPISATCILPFLNKMIGGFDVVGGDEARIGYYVGIMVSIFFATEAITVLYWSRLSDRVGRKPVLLVGLFGVTLSMILVGMSRSFWVLVFSRSLCGALNGNTGVAKSALGEITDNTNVAQAFALFPLVWSLGTMIAPFMGGYLEHPHEHFPRYFDTPFWRTYPYFLPCLVAAVVSGLAFFSILFLLDETLVDDVPVRPPIDRRGTFDMMSSASSATSRSGSPTQPPELTSNLILQSVAAGNPLGGGSLVQGEPALYPHPCATSADKARSQISLMKLLRTPGVALVIGNYGLLAILDIAFAALNPLFLASPVTLGGLGLTPAQIGTIMGAFGLFNGTFQVLFFAPILDRLGARRTFITGMLAFVPIFGCFAGMNAIARLVHLGAADELPGTWVVWVVLALQMASVVAMDLSFGVIMIYIRSVSPSKRSLGATNGIAQLLASIVRAIGPATSTSLFAFSVGHHILGGYAVYLVLILGTAIALQYALMLPRHVREDGENH